MPRIGILISDEAHEALKRHAKRNRLDQGKIVEGLMKHLDEAAVDTAVAELVRAKEGQKDEARSLRGKLNKLPPERLKELLELANKE